MTGIFHGLGTGQTILLVVCILIALGFEFVNGFHDTANAVATVIYTNSLRPGVAVVVSGVFNFLGSFLSKYWGLGVAIGIINLLPVELLVGGGPGAGLSMVLALLLAAILWNLGTWYLGLPASSSHTLIGAILGVGIANSMLPGHVFGAGVNWTKAREVGLSLLVSPLIGFSLAALLLVIVRRFAKDRRLFEPPPKGEPPPPWTRRLLILTCSGVSFAHGSNDGQKGVGLVMLILMGLVPATFSLDQSAGPDRIGRSVEATVVIEAIVTEHSDKAASEDAARAVTELRHVRSLLEGKQQIADLEPAARFEARKAMLVADKAVDNLVKSGGLGLTPAEAKKLKSEREVMRGLTDYAPSWVLVAIALALGIGTTVGWKRIVVTVGEKIGGSHLTYAQGACAEVVAMSTIGIAALSGLPVSTTHVLSSGIAGTMAAQKVGVQSSTVRKIGLAWLLTLPASMILSGGLFLLLHAFLG